MCTTDAGAHAFESASGAVSQEYLCVLDPIAYPSLTGTAGTIPSTTLVRDASITVEIDDASVERPHPDAVVSLGVSDTSGPSAAVTPEIVYR